MKKYCIILLFFITCICRAQDITHNLSAKDAAELVTGLAEKQADTVKIFTLVRLAEYNVLKPGENKPDLDSAGRYLALALRYNSRINSQVCRGRILLARSYLLREKGDTKNGKHAVENAISVLNGTLDKRSLGLAYYELAQYYNYIKTAEMKANLHYIRLSVGLFSESGDRELKAFSLKTLADLDNSTGDSEQALQEAKLSLSTYQAIGYRRLQGVYDLIGGIYFARADFLQALNYRLKALNIAVSEKDTSMQFCQINNGIGMTYMRLKDYRKAIDYLKNALQAAEKINDRPTIISLVFNIAESYNAKGDAKEALAFIKSVPQVYLQLKNPSEDFAIAMMYLEIYTTLKDFSKAGIYSKQLIYIVKLPEINNVFKNYIYSALIKYFIAFRQYRYASSYLRKNELVLIILKNPSANARNYRAWFRLDTLQQNYKLAVKHLLLNNKVADSLLMQNQKRDLKKVTSFYETTQKENAIKLLQAQSTLKETQLQHAISYRKWSLGFALVLSFLLLILIDRYRVKQRMNGILKKQYGKTKLANQTLAVEKSDLLAEKDNLLIQKEWLLSEIHHRVKNNLQTVVSLLESQAVFLENDALQAVQKSQHRIYAMSLIHQKLYSDENLKSVDISRFIPELIRYLNDSYGIVQSIQFHINIDPIKVSVMQAIPLALIINELITNSIQHAFSQKNTEAAITVTMNQSEDRVKLVISDNGVGIDLAGSYSLSGSLGLILINGLSEDLDAVIHIENDNGTKASISFISDLMTGDFMPAN